MRNLGLHTYRLEREVRRLGHAVLELVWPTRCAGCERLGVLLCPKCEDALPRINQCHACLFCGAPAGRLVCTECTPIYEKTGFSFSRACCSLEFSELVRRIIVAYKDGGERRLAPVLAQLLADVVSAEWRRWMDAFTWIPADSSALRRRGFDHMELIARALVEQTGLPAMPLLIKRERSDQRQLNRAERKDNMATVFSVNGFTPASAPRHILLIDDVFTTGATLDAATRALLTAGIGEVRVATVARVW